MYSLFDNTLVFCFDNTFFFCSSGDGFGCISLAREQKDTSRARGALCPLSLSLFRLDKHPCSLSLCSLLSVIKTKNLYRLKIFFLFSLKALARLLSVVIDTKSLPCKCFCPLLSFCADALERLLSLCPDQVSLFFSLSLAPSLAPSLPPART